jgi:hypothetical protein
VDATGWPDTDPDGTFADKSSYPNQGDSVTMTDVYDLEFPFRCRD